MALILLLVQTDNINDLPEAIRAAVDNEVNPLIVTHGVNANLHVSNNEYLSSKGKQIKLTCDFDVLDLNYQHIGEVIRDNIEQFT